MTKSEIIRRLASRFPETPDLQLARIVNKRYPILFGTVEQARSMVRYVRGHNGRVNRKHIGEKLVPRRPKTACPDSIAEIWTPVDLPPGKTLVLSDVHVPYHDRKAVEAAVSHGRKFKPDIVLLNGDIIDFYALSRFERRPDLRDANAEVQSCLEFLRWIRAQFPKAQLIYKIGNHEQRWDRLIWDKAPELWGIQNVQLHNVLEFDALGIQRVNDEPIMAGGLAVFHGHELPKGIANPVNPARGAFMRTLASVLIGHLHRSSTHPEPNLWHDEVACWSIGCLCYLYPPYARVNKWNHGFAEIESFADKQFDVTNCRVGKHYEIRTS